MKAHPSLTRQHVLAKGPDAIALMIASEFGRAANRSRHRENVLSCYRRARELMGILETISLPADVSQQLKPWYQKATEQELLTEERLHPDWVQKFCLAAAAEFNRAATTLP